MNEDFQNKIMNEILSSADLLDEAVGEYIHKNSHIEQSWKTAQMELCVTTIREIQEKAALSYASHICALREKEGYYLLEREKEGCC